MRVFAVDPGSEETGWIVCNNLDSFQPRDMRIEAMGITPNAAFMTDVFTPYCDEGHDGELVCAIEWFVPAIRRMALQEGQDEQTRYLPRQSIETYGYTMRLRERWLLLAGHEPAIVTRTAAVKHLGATKKKPSTDAQVSAALRLRFGEKGTKAKPGILYGIRSHTWAALAVAVYHADRNRIPF